MIVFALFCLPCFWRARVPALVCFVAVSLRGPGDDENRSGGRQSRRPTGLAASAPQPRPLVAFGSRVETLRGALRTSRRLPEGPIICLLLLPLVRPLICSRREQVPPAGSGASALGGKSNNKYCSRRLCSTRSSRSPALIHLSRVGATARPQQAYARLPSRPTNERTSQKVIISLAVSLISLASSTGGKGKEASWRVAFARANI